MKEIEHKHILVNGLKLHVAEIGGGSPPSPAVVFLHGFPEIWYSWRHQMIAAAEAGFRAIAPDYRGYGLSDPPPVPEDVTFSDLIADLLALLDALSLSKALLPWHSVGRTDMHLGQILAIHLQIEKRLDFATPLIFYLCPYLALASHSGFLIGKDFGARIAYIFALLHSGRVSGIITLGVPFMPPSRPTVAKHLPGGSYISRWQERGRAEADFRRFDCKTVVRNIYILFSRDVVPTADENQEIMDIVDPSTPLPAWFTEEDLEVYASLYEKSRFQTALQVPYRSLHEEFNIDNLKVEVPALVITGGKDYSLRFPGVEDYIKSRRATVYVPNYETAHLPEGSHFMQEQFPDEVNQLILDFLRNHS